MLSGSLNSENLAQCLRDLSQRRRQGALQVEFADQKLEVLLVQGRIVDVIDLAVSPVKELLDLLHRSGMVPEEIQYEPSLLSYQSLFELLDKSDHALDQATFKDVLLHRVLEKLYKLDNRGGGFFIFQMRMVEYDRAFSPSVSVGQLLLDLVALRNDLEKFEDLFHPGVLVEPVEGAGASLNSEESYVWRLIGSGIEYTELRARCYLSAFHFQDALLSFYSKDLVQLGKARAKAGALDISSIADALDAEIDSSFEEAAARGAIAEAPHSAMLEESAEAVPRLSSAQSVKARLNLWNLKLLQSRMIPAALSYAFLLAAAIAPFLFWGEVLKDF